MPLFNSEVKIILSNNHFKWLITGVAGFIGSSLLEYLLKENQTVFGIDNFSTGSKDNLHKVNLNVTLEQWGRFEFLETDLNNVDSYSKFLSSADYVLHQAAIGSVPRSLEFPLGSHHANSTGFLSLLSKAKIMGTKSIVYASSSSVYGDHPDLPKVENQIGYPLSPYAVTKLTNELYADVFSKQFGMNIIGLRYFNVFGPRQNPNGPYAAVIPRWISAAINGETITINGDGQTSRDFTYIDNIVWLNISAALKAEKIKGHQVFNGACAGQITLNQLYDVITETLKALGYPLTSIKAYSEFRKADVRHSFASIKKAKELLDYEPLFGFEEGIRRTISWSLEQTLPLTL